MHEIIIYAITHSVVLFLLSLGIYYRAIVATTLEANASSLKAHGELLSTTNILGGYKRSRLQTKHLGMVLKSFRNR